MFDIEKLAALVRLIPAYPGEVPSAGYGFPLRFRVEVSGEREFRSPEILDHSREDFLNPGDNIVSTPAHGIRARYVRVTATRLYEEGTRGGGKVFALAELQVYSGGRNVALGAGVHALDVLDGPRPAHIAGFYPEGPTWGLKFLVDGYSSRHRLIELDDWLKSLARRGHLTHRLTEIQAHRAVVREEAATLSVWLGAALTLLLGGSLIGAILNSRRRRNIQLRELRRCLARDLHDDIGSSLGGIRLASQLAQSVEGTPDTVIRDLREIDQVAGEAADSMRDIVWLLDGEAAGAEELIVQMQLIAGRMLADRDFKLEVYPAADRRQLQLELRRNVLYAFKEALYNAVRHSGAGRIEVSIDGRLSHFGFQIRDNGHGFDPEEGKPGHGLANLRNRAAVLRGWVKIESATGRGASIEFRVPVV